MTSRGEAPGGDADAAPDAASGAPTDAATDAASDAPTDAATDAAPDAPSDVPTDAASDAAPDAPSDAPSDASSDAPGFSHHGEAPGDAARRGPDGDGLAAGGASSTPPAPEAAEAGAPRRADAALPAAPPAHRDARRAALALATRACARYAVPFTALAALAALPAAAWLWRRGAGPVDAGAGRRLAQAAWVVAASAWAWRHLVVAAVTPAVAALGRGAPLTQAAALRAGLGGLRRGVVPTLASIGCVALAGLGLGVPALVALPLVALVGASPRLGDPLPAPLLDAAARARRALGTVALVTLGAIAVDLALAWVAQRLLATAAGPRAAGVARAAELRRFGHVVLVTLVILAPLPAAVLAALAGRGPDETRPRGTTPHDG